MNKLNHMNLMTNINQYDESFVYILDPIKNNIISNGYFIRIIFSNSLFSLNGIYLKLDINLSLINKFCEKYKYSFDVFQHKDVIEKMRIIENGLIEKFNIKYKQPKNSIYQQLSSGFIKIFSHEITNNTNNLFIKISGFWQTEYEYGLTYKFLIN